MTAYFKSHIEMGIDKAELNKHLACLLQKKDVGTKLMNVSLVWLVGFYGISTFVG